MVEPMTNGGYTAIHEADINGTKYEFGIDCDDSLLMASVIIIKRPECPILVSRDYNNDCLLRKLIDENEIDAAAWLLSLKMILKQPTEIIIAAYEAAVFKSRLNRELRQQERYAIQLDPKSPAYAVESDILRHYGWENIISVTRYDEDNGQTVVGQIFYAPLTTKT